MPELLCIIQMYVMISIVPLYFNLLNIDNSQIKNHVREYNLFRSFFYYKISVLVDPNISPRKVLYHKFLISVIRSVNDRMVVGLITTKWN